MPTDSTVAAISLYAGAVLGVLGLLGLMRPSRVPFRAGATLIGLAGLAWLFVQAAKAGGGLSGPPAPAPVVMAFGTIAVAGAVRMVTHPRPVFAALYFILVVLASSAMFLLMQAEFMAFALIIVYAGAILITYLFVIMLAQESPSAAAVAYGQEDYDRVPREPIVAAAVGFVMLAVLAETLLGPRGPMPPDPARATAAANELRWQMVGQMPGQVLEMARSADPAAAEVLPQADGTWLSSQGGVRSARVASAGGADPRTVTLGAVADLENSRAVGMSLVADFPVSLELAGVILLMAMWGAVVLARRQIELGEDERREAAGLRRLSVDEPEADRGAAARRGGAA
ncbi:MAG: NADH-quinone oxidoreductase subunit J [Phycisphaerales bacterium]